MDFLSCKRWFRLAWATAFLLFVSAPKVAWGQESNDTEENGSTGAIARSADYVKRMEGDEAAPLPAAADAEPIVSLRPRYHPVLDQGKKPSCTAFAVAAAKTYLERVTNGWEDDAADHVFSPAYLYSKLDIEERRGIYLDTALDFLKGGGCCTWKLMPYNPSLEPSPPQPTPDALAEAHKYRPPESWDWHCIRSKDTAEIRKNLVAGHAIVIVAHVDTLQRKWSVNERGVTESYRTDSPSAHAMVVIGYDDEKNGEGHGAFQVLNSWGPQWNPRYDGSGDGTAWISYQFWPYWVNEAYVCPLLKKNLPLPKAVKVSTLNSIPVGPEGAKNGNWGYSREINLKAINPTDKKLPEAIKQELKSVVTLAK